MGSNFPMKVSIKIYFQSEVLTTRLSWKIQYLLFQIDVHVVWYITCFCAQHDHKHNSFLLIE